MSDAVGVEDEENPFSAPEPQKPLKETKFSTVSWYRGVGLKCCKSLCCLLTRTRGITTPEDVLLEAHQISAQVDMCCISQQKQLQTPKHQGWDFFFFPKKERTVYRVWTQSVYALQGQFLWSHSSPAVSNRSPTLGHSTMASSCPPPTLSVPLSSSKLRTWQSSPLQWPEKCGIV